MAAKEFIVAIELGSSKVTGIAGKKNRDGSISVLAVVKEDSASFIRRGVVYNINQTVQCLSNIIRKLSTALKSEIAKVYVGVGGQSLRSIKNVNIKDLADGTIVTQDMVNEMMDLNRSMSYQGREIVDVAVQEYKVDNQLQTDPVGIPCNRLEGNFLNITWREAFCNNLYTCFDAAGVAIAEMFPAPMALADSVLTDEEKRSGCVLVDLGADTTTVSVYYKNILRHLSVIPLGGNSVTKDIASLQIDEDEAEKLKLKHGRAYTDTSESDTSQMISTKSGRAIDAEKLADVVEARMQEIIENVWSQVADSGYADRLLGGVILTGGGSNMSNICNAFTNYTHTEKIRVAKFVKQTINSSNADINARNGMMNTVLALLAKGEINCAGEETGDQQDLFGQKQPAEMPTTVIDSTRRNGETPHEGQGTATNLSPEDQRRIDNANSVAVNAGGEAAGDDADNEGDEGSGNAKKRFKKLKNFFEKLLKDPDEEETESK